MKYTFLFLSILTLFACKEAANQQDDGKVDKEDLSKLSWLEGDWTADFKGQPFYERFKMIDDTTMEYTTYVFIHSKDSNRVMTHKVIWADTSYYLGVGKNYRAVEMNKQGVKFVPHLQSINDIYWTYVGDDAWKVLLATPRDTVIYNMSRIQNLDEILNNSAVPDSLR
jgi:hypothetical protein